MLSKNQIIQAADKLSKNGQANTELMKFVLKPGNNSMQQPMASHGSMGPMSTGLGSMN